MLLLTSTSDVIRVITSASGDIDVHASWVDRQAGTPDTITPGRTNNNLTGTGTTDVVASPAAGFQRTVQFLVVRNEHATVTNVVEVAHWDGTYEVSLFKASLSPGEMIQLGANGFSSVDVNGNIMTAQGIVAAGTDKTIQFNDGGSIVNGDSGLIFDKTTDTLSLPNAGAAIRMGVQSTPTANPATPPSGQVAMFARKVGGRSMPSFIGPSGLDSSLQPLLARNKIGVWLPPGNAATVPAVIGLTALTAQGTATTRTVATTSLATRMRRLGYPTSATTAGLFIGARLAVAQFSCGSGSGDGSGFMMVERWVESDPAPVTGRRVFTGMTAATTALTNVEYDTLTNVVGVIQKSTDATQWYSIAAGSSAQTAVALGTALGAPGGNSTTAWELVIFAPNGVANTYYCQMTNITTGAYVEWTVTGAATVCPQSTTLLAWNHGGTNNATALATGMDLCSLYIETDT